MNIFSEEHQKELDNAKHALDSIFQKVNNLEKELEKIGGFPFLQKLKVQLIDLQKLSHESAKKEELKKLTKQFD